MPLIRCEIPALLVGFLLPALDSLLFSSLFLLLYMFSLSPDLQGSIAYCACQA